MNKKYFKLAVINVLILIPSIFTLFFVGIPNRPTSWSYHYGTYGYGPQMRSVSISSNGTYVVCGLQGEIILIDQAQREVLWRFQSGNEYFFADISADGFYIAACAINGEVYLFNKLSNVPIWSYSAPYTTTIQMDSIAISRDGNYIIAANYDDQGKLFLFNNTSSNPVWIYTSPDEDGFSSVAISDNGSFIFATTWCGNASLFNNVIGTPLWTYDPFPDDGCLNSPNVAISSDGNYMAMLGDGQAIAFNKTSPIPYWIYNPIKTEMNRNRNICITSNGSKIYCVGDGIYIFDTTATSSPLIKYIQYSQINSIGISQDGQYFATNCMGIISIYNGFTNIWENDLRADSSVVDMSDDGSFIVSGSVEKIFFINRDFPEFIEDYNMRFIIGIIAIVGSFTLEGIMIKPVSKYIKRSKFEKKKRQQENFEKLMSVSSKIRVGMLKNVLRISKKDLNEKIERWQRDFNVKVEGEYIVFNEENLPDIIDLLDEKYEEWTTSDKKHKEV